LWQALTNDVVEVTTAGNSVRGVGVQRTPVATDLALLLDSEGVLLAEDWR